MKPTMAVLTGVLMMTQAATATAQRPPVEHFGRPSLGAQPLPFSEAVRVGDTLYLSGQIGVGPSGKLPPTFEAQAKQTMDNIGAVLKARGLGWGDVVKCTVMLSDMANWPAFNKIYVPYFPAGKLPARSAFGANGLALGALIEVECLAYTGKR